MCSLSKVMSVVDNRKPALAGCRFLILVHSSQLVWWQCQSLAFECSQAAASPRAAGEVTPVLSLVVLPMWVEKTRKNPGGRKPIWVFPYRLCCSFLPLWFLCHLRHLWLAEAGEAEVAAFTLGMCSFPDLLLCLFQSTQLPWFSFKRW